ncbi:hypothetical protein C8R44DRAFT_744002 [Mycena epipterygia]|nr:hypothetical protein C8R44DRAFT_744002 [Mycena epipterygia]
MPVLIPPFVCRRIESSSLFMPASVSTLVLSMLYPWDFEGVMGVLAGLEVWGISTISKQVTEQKSPRCITGEEMPTKVMILAQFEHKYYICGSLKRLTDLLPRLKAWWICFGHGYYIHGTLKRLTDVVARPKAWSRTRNPFHCGLAGVEMPAKVVILAQFDRGYYIHGTFKRLTDVVARLRALWICFEHEYYIRGTLKRLTDVVAWLKAW